MKKQLSVQEAYNTIAKDFSQTRHSAWGEFQEFAKHLPKNAKVLDIGCGNGRLYEFLKSYNVDYTGVDISENLLEEARKKHPEIQAYHDDMTQLASVSNEKFDAIFFIASFHHLSSKKERLECLERVKQLLKPRGKIYMTNWNLFQKKYRKYIFRAILRSLFSPYAWNDTYIPFHQHDEVVWRYYHAFTPYELNKLFKQAGFDIVDSFAYSKDKRVSQWLESRNLCYVLSFDSA